MKVIWSHTAVADLIEIYDFIARDSAHYARRMVDRITARSSQLARFPESGSIVPEFHRDDIRQVIEGVYRIIYQRTEHDIFVLTVMHGARRLNELLPPDE